jgi:hypothetical protein
MPRLCDGTLNTDSAHNRPRSYSAAGIHPSTMRAVPLTFVVGTFAVPIGMTAAWPSFAAWQGQSMLTYLLFHQAHLYRR